MLVERGTTGSPTQNTFLLVDAFGQLAAARKASYFINLKEWREPSGVRMYVIGFSNASNVSIHEYFGQEYSLTNEYGQPRGFMSVSEWSAVRRDGPLPAPKDK